MTVRHTSLFLGMRDFEATAALLGSPSSAPRLPASEVQAATAYARAEKSVATRKAYRADFELFRIWCEARRTSALPAVPGTVAAFLGVEADRGLRPSTLGRRLAAIRYAHKLAGLPVPTDDERVLATMRGVRRSLRAAPVKKSPATADKIMAMAAIADGRLTTLRDRALLLFGFASAMRRSELAALDVGDIEEANDGLRVTIRRSKCDQGGRGEMIAVPRGNIVVPGGCIKKMA